MEMNIRLSTLQITLDTPEATEQTEWDNKEATNDL
jgi:hypothetical protein